MRIDDLMLGLKRRLETKREWVALKPDDRERILAAMREGVTNAIVFCSNEISQESAVEGAKRSGIALGKHLKTVSMGTHLVILGEFSTTLLDAMKLTRA